MDQSNMLLQFLSAMRQSNILLQFLHHQLTILHSHVYIIYVNSVLKIYLLNTQLNCHIMSFNYFILFICFIKQFVGSI